MLSSPNSLAFSPERTHTGEPNPLGRPHLRFVLAGVLLAAELCAVAVIGHPWVPVGQSMAGPIVLLAALLFFGRRRIEFARFSAHSFDGLAATIHVGALAIVLFSAYTMLHALSLGSPLLVSSIAGWFFALATMLMMLPLTLAPMREWSALIRRLGVAWIYAIGCAMLAMSARRLELLAWDAPDSTPGRVMAGGAFAGVRYVLQLFFPGVSADPATRIIGVGDFHIHVAGACSGIEGITLMLFLTLGWMMVERKQLRLMRALWLTPVALLLVWCLNVLRMVALIALGAAGEPEIAIKGFHTEAGWITFTLVGVSFLAAANRLPWLRRDAAVVHEKVSNPATAYLLPMVVLLSVSLVTQAFSNGFESLYPVRFAVVMAVLFVLRRPLLAMRWSAGWTDAAAGFAVGAVWVWFSRGGDAGGAHAGLAGLPYPSRIAWLTIRTVAAVVTVPLCEELAFRGFLARRLASFGRLNVPEFEELPYRAVGWLGMASSSLAFGVMHGRWWILGSFAGLVFVLLARRRDSIGAAVVAHGAANLVLAVWALTTGDLSVW